MQQNRIKVAVLISGDYRTFDVCRPSMIVIDDPSVDVYFSTWSTTTFELLRYGLKQTREITRAHIASILNRPATIAVDDYSVNYGKYSCDMIHRWKAGINLIKQSGTEYDYVVVVRPDLFFDATKPFDLADISRYAKTPGFGWFEHPGKLNDIMFVSSFAHIKTIIDNIDMQSWISADADWHQWWSAYIARTGLTPVGILGGRSTIARFWVRPGHTFPDVADIESKWRDLVLLHHIDLCGVKPMLLHWTQDVIDNAIHMRDSGAYDNITLDD